MAGADEFRRGDGLRAEQAGTDLGALGGEVVGEAAQVTEVVSVASGHVGAAPVAGIDQPVVDEQLQGLAQGHQAHAELVGQFPLGWQRAADGPSPAGDAIAQVAVDTQVLRLPVGGARPREAGQRLAAGCASSGPA